MTLHVNSFGGGAVVEGAAGTRRIDEVLVADSVDIGPRGALVCTSDVSDYVLLKDGAAAPAPWTRIFGLISAMPGFSQAKVIAVGQGTVRNFPGWPYGPTYILRDVARENETTPLGVPIQFEFAPIATHAPEPPSAEGACITGLSWPGAWWIPVGQQVNIAFINIGAREGYAPRSNALFGLWVLLLATGGGPIGLRPIKSFNALGTGPLGDGVLLPPIPPGTYDTGNKSQQLYFRGVIAYNNFLFGWGFDSADTVAGDGPTRVMFCNLGRPLKWGNDNATTGTPPVPVTGNRTFTDSDAIGLGDAGEIIRAGCRALGKVFFGTNRGLHFIQGYDRSTFVTNGSIPVMKAYNVIGPGALLEGPDRVLYGVGDQGLWRYDGGSVPEPLFLKNWDFAGHSAGYWELLWVNPNAAPGYPGRSNMDLVWMAVDFDKLQVLVGIPFCNASTGTGSGGDTVVIKYHIQTGGFTRQVFPGVNYTAAAYLRQEGQTKAIKWLGHADATSTIGRYAYQSTAGESPMMPRRLPTLVFGPYAPFGPDGQGVVRRIYLTLSWEDANALPLVFQITTYTDQAPVNDYLLTIGSAAPVTPADGDCWLDTSNSNLSIGNAVAGVDIPARGGFLFKTWNTGEWQVIAGQGAKGTRVSLPLPLVRVTGTFVTVGVDDVAAAGRFQVEGLGLEPGGGTPAA